MPNQNQVPNNHAQQNTFYGLGIAPMLLDILDKQKFTIPTPIQQKAIPSAIEGKDLIGVAQTGTGKTLAFGIPMVQRLAQVKGRGLILVPTRELAQQVEESLRKIASPFSIYSVVLIGGASMYHQVQALRRHPRIIIATPGRLLDHMRQRTINLSDIQVLVLDEADRMLDMGFAPQIEQVLQTIPKTRQTMLFSATMPPEIVRVATRHMQLPLQVEIAPSGTTIDKITQELFIVSKISKLNLLSRLLHQYQGSVLLFSRTKIGAKKITSALRMEGHKAAEIHSDRSLSQRREALDGFKSGRYRILVATDIASRGIDVKNIEVVINFDLPDDVDNFVHRIGRTGRAGRPGHAITFATPEQGKEVREIESLIRSQIPIAKHPELPMETFISARPSSGPSRSGGGRRHGGWLKRRR